MVSTLYRPGRIGALTVKNRIVMAAMHTALSADGTVNRALIEYFGRRARGGTGLIVVGAAGVDPVLVNTRNVIGAYHDRFIPGLSLLSGEIHARGSRCFLQLFHPGRYGKTAEYGNKTPVAPSAVPSGFTGEMPRELTEEETEIIIGYYAQAARRAGAAGFDGVEITAASGYLPAQFLSPLTNLRTDRYGGGLDGRTTFLKETIRGIRKISGEDFPIMVRLGGSDLIPGSHTADEAVLVASALEKEGVDAVSLTGGWHESAVPQLTMDVPHGVLLYMAGKLKKVLGIPLVMSNRLTPKVAEELADSGLIDFAAFGRGLLADPSMPAKAAEGRYSSIRPCIGCNQGCMDRIFFGESIRCLVNPEAGREALWGDSAAVVPEASRSTTPQQSAGYVGSARDGLYAGSVPRLSPNESPASPFAASARSKLRGTNPACESILIVGGGVAGLNCAVEASLRGHRPVVWEKESYIGGQASLASNLDERSEIARYVDYLGLQCRERGIPLIVNKAADGELIKEAVARGEFDSVVLATGKEAAPSNLESDGSIPICHGWDVMKGIPVPAKKIVIKGGGALGIWTALKLAARGRISADQYRFLNLYNVDSCEKLKGALNDWPGTITIVSSGKSLCSDMSKSSKWVYLGRLKQLGIPVLKEHEILNIRDHSVLIGNKDGGVRSVDADVVVETETFVQRERDLYDALRGTDIDVSLIGDARSPGNLFSAVNSGYLKGAARE